MPVANQQIGPYTLIKKLGQGGFGEVWLAEKQVSHHFNAAVDYLFFCGVL